MRGETSVLLSTGLVSVYILLLLIIDIVNTYDIPEVVINSFSSTLRFDNINKEGVEGLYKNIKYFPFTA